MADLNEIMFPSSFSDFPEDVQLSILSFLNPADAATFACTSKRFLSLCRSDAKLWFAVCERRWGHKTQIKKWANGKVTYRQLYKALNEFENLIGFWRRSGQGKSDLNPPPPPPAIPPPLVFFEWGPTFVTGSRVSPSKTGTYDVVKAPFLWMGMGPGGEQIGFLDPDCRFELPESLASSGELGFLENELVPVTVSSMGSCHVILEENLSFRYSKSDSPEKRIGGFRRVSSSGNVRGEDDAVVGVENGSPGSLPDRLMSEIYQYFANPMSPGGDRASRRQRRRERERQGRRKWEPEHLVKIVNCSPTQARPLQGLWKGICDDMNLDFYLVVYDDIGGVACRRVGDPSKPFSGYAPVFWTSSTTFIKSPFPPEEKYMYESREHLQPIAAANDFHGGSACSDIEAVTRILYVNSSYDLVIPDLVGTTVNPRQVEGRIWQYRNGTFGFGFLRNDYIIDLKHIAQNGCLLDIMQLCNA